MLSQKLVDRLNKLQQTAGGTIYRNKHVKISHTSYRNKQASH